MRLMSVIRRWSRLLAPVAVAAVLGFVAGMAGQERALAHVNPGDLHSYTYSDDSSCFDSSPTEKDPINIVFIQHGFTSEINARASQHGGWDTTGNAQWFGDQEGCHESDGSRASNAGQWPFDGGRYHMRHYFHENSVGEVRTYSFYGAFSSAAAHHEEVVLCGGNPSSHAVDDDTDGTFIDGLNITVYGGFNAGREDVNKNWVFYGDHVIIDTHYWDNKRSMDQCNGWDASSDGWVYYIGTFESTDGDSDGCLDARENQPKADSNIGGGRDPNNPWDYYDVSVPKDGVIDLPNDILGVIRRFSPGGLPPYNAYYDRGPRVSGNAWNMNAPDGVIDLPNDILGVVIQFNPSGCG